MFLLDTSFVSEAVNPQARKHRAAHDFVNQNALFADQFYLCVITLSEMEFGLNLLSLQQPPAASERVAEVKSRIEQMVKMGEMLTVDHHVAREHARLRAAYAAVRMPNVIAKRKFKARPVERWYEAVNSPQLHISENDLWIAAVALTYDLVLVAIDVDYVDLRRAVPELLVQIL